MFLEEKSLFVLCKNISKNKNHYKISIFKINIKNDLRKTACLFCWKYISKVIFVKK